MRTKYSLLLCALCLVLAPLALHAQSGALDPTFNGTGYVIQPVNGKDGTQKILVQDDQKILVVGMSWDDTFTARAYVFRYLPDGTPDTEFATDGVFEFELDNEALFYSARITSAGKILLVGATTDYQTYRMLLVQLNMDGTPDDTFGTNGVATPVVSLVGPNAEDMAYDVTEDAQGRILICGSSYDENYVRRPVVVRLTSTGAIDTTFGIDGVATIPVMAVGSSVFNGILVQPDGKIVACGEFGETELWYTLLLVRFDEDGFLDESFSDDGIVRHNYGNVDDTGYDLELTSDGSIVVAGNTVTVTYNYSALLMKFTPDGEVDDTFGTMGAVMEDLGQFDYAWDVSVQGDGRILMGGTAGNGPPNDFDMAVWKYMPDGTPDSSYGDNGMTLHVIPGYSTMIYAMELQADGKILIGGQARVVAVNDNSFFIARLENDITSGISDASGSGSAQTFPNPAAAGTEVMVTIPENIAGAHADLYNMEGQLVHSYRIDQLQRDTRNFRFRLPASLTPGAYQLSVQQQAGARFTSTILIND